MLLTDYFDVLSQPFETYFIVLIFNLLEKVSEASTFTEMVEHLKVIDVSDATLYDETDITQLMKCPNSDSVPSCRA